MIAIKKAMSPTEEKQSKNEDGMTFPGAMEVVSRGGKVRRLEWEDREIYCTMHEHRLSVMNEKHQMAEWIISDGDMEGDDWVEV